MINSKSQQSIQIEFFPSEQPAENLSNAYSGQATDSSRRRAPKSKIRPKIAIDEQLYSLLQMRCRQSGVGLNDYLEALILDDLGGDPAATNHWQPDAAQGIRQNRQKMIPPEVFRNKTGLIYYFLYSLTRGARKPKRAVRIAKARLKKETGIGSLTTLDKHLKHLTDLGYLKITVNSGEQAGNRYEVFVTSELS